MKTGLDSLDTGAPKITYSGNEGPKAPMQMAGPDRYFKILEFKINELEGELGRDLTDEEYKAVSEEAYEEFSSGARAPQGIESMKMASYRPGKYDPEDIEMYEQYKYDMEEQKPGMPIMEIDEFLRLEREQGRIGVADGGVMQLVKKNADGSRPGYRGRGSKETRDNRQSYSATQAAANVGKASTAANNRESNIGNYTGGNRPDRTDPNVGNRSDAFTPAKTATPMDVKEQYRVGNDITTDTVLPPPMTTLRDPKTNKFIPLTDETKLLRKKVEDQNKQKIEDFVTYKKPPPTTGLKTVDLALKFINNILPTEYGRDYYAKTVVGKPYYDEESDTYKTFGLDQASYDAYDKLRKENKINAAGRELSEFERTLIQGNYDGPNTGNLIAGQTTPPGTVPPGTTPPGTTPPGTTTSPFLPATNFNQYDTDQANKAYMLSLGVDPRMFAADGGRMGYAGGGIADLRQGYFLGKLVKKVTRGAKKVLKSPFGRAAIMAGLGAFGLNQYGQGVDFMDKLKNLGRIAFLNKGETEFTKANINPFKIFGGISALSALPLLFGTGDEKGSMDGYRGEGLNIRGIRGDVAKRNLNPIDYPFMPQEYYMANGGIAGARTSALNELYGIDDEDEVKKLSQGGSAGLPPVTMMSEGQNIQSFGDDESTGMPQATPTMPNQMPMRPPMMDPRMQQQMMMSRSMSPMMNPMMRGMPMMGGRMMAQEGGIMMAGGIEMDANNEIMERIIDDLMEANPNLSMEEAMEEAKKIFNQMASRQMPRPNRVMAQEGGMMDMGGMEKDYRNEGGFVAIGGQERADDVPARLSKNEFVFTADAVRNAGGGDIDKGAEIMENMMENLEAGGKVSEASQGLKGARQMFATSQRLEEVL